MKKRIIGLMAAVLCFMAVTVPINAAGIKNDMQVDKKVSSVIQPRYQYVIKTNGGNVNVRSGPGTEYAVIGSLPNGTIVDIPFYDPDHETKPGWEYVYSNIVNGYVSTQYIANID